ncbi:MAG TPA: hypothetical protein VFD56_09205 [Chitinophagaceae bacterium]|nr:hypothetical protein [Chitinophagaceae bacterium]
MNLENKRIVDVTGLRPLIDLRYSVILASILVLGNVAQPAFGQRNAKNAIYLEAASEGPIYSLNYDRIIRQGEKLAYSLRAGFSIEKDALSFPVGFNFITGKYAHHGEFGLTIIPYFQYHDDYPTRNYTGNSDKYIFVNPAAGYRFQKPGRSIFLKAAIGPSVFLDPPAGDFWNMDPKLYFFGSVSAGISF